MFEWLAKDIAVKGNMGYLVLAQMFVFVAGFFCGILVALVFKLKRELKERREEK